MNHAMSPADYKDLVLFLATAGIVAPLFKRLKLNPILGFLIAGVILGPFGLGALSKTLPWLDYVTVDNPQEIAQLAEFGVVFLMFAIGLEFSLPKLRAMRKQVFGLGLMQVVLTMAVVSGLALVLSRWAGGVWDMGGIGHRYLWHFQGPPAGHLREIAPTH